MLLTEPEIAREIGPPLTLLSPLAQKRKVRKLIRQSGVIPHIFYTKGGETWCLPRDYVTLILQCQMNSKSSPKAVRPTGTSWEQSMVKKSMKLQEYLTEA